MDVHILVDAFCTYIYMMAIVFTRISIIFHVTVMESIRISIIFHVTIMESIGLAFLVLFWESQNSLVVIDKEK